MKPFVLAQVPVFAPDSLPGEDLEYLKAAAADADTRCVQEVAGRLHIQVSSNPEENLYLYGTKSLKAMFEAVQEMEASAFSIDLDPTPTLERIRKYELPCDVSVECGIGFAAVGGNLVSEFVDQSSEAAEDDPRADAAADAVESMLIALATEGFDLGTPAFEQAFDTAVESIGLHL